MSSSAMCSTNERPVASLDLVVLVQVGAELLDRFFLVGAEVADQGHVGAGPVGAGVVPAAGGRDQQMVVRDLDVVPHLLPRDAGRHQAYRGRVGVVELQVLEHASPSGWATQHAGARARAVRDKNETAGRSAFAARDRGEGVEPAAPL